MSTLASKKRFVPLLMLSGLRPNPVKLPPLPKKRSYKYLSDKPRSLLGALYPEDASTRVDLHNAPGTKRHLNSDSVARRNKRWFHMVAVRDAIAILRNEGYRWGKIVEATGMSKAHLFNIVKRVDAWRGAY